MKKDVLIKNVKNFFKENKERLFWENIDIDALNEECILKNSLIITKKNEIIAYFKFEKVDIDSIENEIAISNYRYKDIFMKTTIKVYGKILEKYILENTIFKDNRTAIDISKRLGFNLFNEFNSFVIENENYNPEKETKELAEPIIIKENEIISTNGCYLFFETELLTDEALAELLRLAEMLNHKYICVFTEKIHLLMNFVPFKKTQIYLKDSPLEKKYENIIKNFKLPNNMSIINNLKFEINLDL